MAGKAANAVLSAGMAALLGGGVLAASYAPSPSAAAVPTIVAAGCGDLLAKMGKKPPGARYTGCTSHPEQQAAPLEATYDVAGRDAAAAEAYLVRAFGLEPLRRSCCQWDAPPKSFDDAEGGAFFITMTSDETGVRTRENWPSIPRFQIVIKMFTGEI
jgi:hypothetical protein